MSEYYDKERFTGGQRPPQKKNDGEIPEGIHDQSLFAFKPSKLMEYIERYKDYLGIKNEEGEL